MTTPCWWALSQCFTLTFEVVFYPPLSESMLIFEFITRRGFFEACFIWTWKKSKCHLFVWPGRIFTCSPSPPPSLHHWMKTETSILTPMYLRTCTVLFHKRPLGGSIRVFKRNLSPWHHKFGATVWTAQRRRCVQMSQCVWLEWSCDLSGSVGG